MHRSEMRELEYCTECGAEIHSSRDRTFALDSERSLCFACAVQRGGSFDAGHDVWTRAPDLSGLGEPEE
jgi:hypothetical protein